MLYFYIRRKKLYMKKKLLAIALVSCFSTVALASCGNEQLTKEDGVVLTIDGEQYTTEDLFGQFSTSNATGVAAYYKAISELLIRNATRSYAESTELERTVSNRIEKIKEEARDNASTNGTKYKAELDSLLESNGVEDLDELKEKFKFEELQDYLEDEYYDLNTNSLLSDYLDEMLPYHVRHILVNVSAASGTLYNGTISQNEAMALAAVVRRMGNVNKDGSEKATKETFGEVAYDASDDSGSASLYGNLDVMTIATSFVNEFKLGIYAYEALFAQKNADGRGSLLTSNDSSAEFGIQLQKNTYAIPANAQTKWSARHETIVTKSNYVGGVEVPTADGTEERRVNGIGYIPFEITQKLEEVADVTVDPITKKQINDGDADYYPRNIYFNYYFNDHGINVITNENAVGNFVYVDAFGTNVLCADGDATKPILVTRAGSSYQGVHFMVVEKSAIGATHDELATYYDKRTPSQLTKDGQGSLIGSTYVTAIKSTDTKTYTDRSTSIENEVKNFDTMLDARIFEYYLGIAVDKSGNVITPVDKDGNTIPTVTISDDKLQKQLVDYIVTTRAKNKSTSIYSNAEAWDSYIRLLELQDYYSDRRVPLVCAQRFLDGEINATTGGSCYVEK